MSEQSKPTDGRRTPRAPTDHAHAGALRILKLFLDQKGAADLARDVSPDDTATAAGKQAFSVVEDVRRRSVDGTLPADHRDDFLALRFTVAGVPFQECLDAQQLTRNAQAALASTVNKRLIKARAQLTAAEDSLRDAQARAEVARIHAQSMEAYARDFEDRIRLDLKEIALRQADVAGRVHTARLELLTTEELAERIRYDPRTIRERMTGNVFIEGVHFMRPFGRKITFMWGPIERDMLNGTFAASAATHSDVD